MPGSRVAALALAAALLAPIAAGADPAHDELLGAGGPSRQMSAQELEGLLQYGAGRKLTIFELFDEVIVALAARGQRLTIGGDDLRAAALRYDLGGERVASLLPVDKVASVALGAAAPGGPGELEVQLREEHSQYLEMADIRLASRYGFKKVSPGLFAGGFGASVRRLLFTFNLESLELYDRNKVAIHVRGFSQPKRWRITRITPKLSLRG